MNDLPKGLLRFIEALAGRLHEFDEGEVREVSFKNLDDFTLESFDVASYALADLGVSGLPEDETRSFQGYSLLATAGAYEALGVLVWFPCWKAFGSWDCDHHLISVFPDTNWETLEMNLQAYVNAQWDPGSVPCVHVDPWNTPNRS